MYEVQMSDYNKGRISDGYDLIRFFRDSQDYCDAARKFEAGNVNLRKDAIAHEKEEQWRQEGKQLLFDAKKENVGLQLEAAYRNNAMELYKQVCPS